MKIGDKCFVSGHIDEIRKDTVIVRNSGGYFGTSPGEVITVYNTARPNWIPCSERLPDNSRNVLITHKGGVTMAWYNGLYFEKGANTHHRKIQTVTAWCELPEPYRER